MRRVPRLAAAGIVLLPLCAVAWMGYLTLARYYHAQQRDLGPVVADELSAALNRKVTVGSVDVHADSATLVDVTIAQLPGQGSRHEPMLATAHIVRLNFNLQSLLLGANPTLPLFTSVQLVNPVLYLSRDAKDRWNFADLIKPRPKTSNQQAVGRITVVNGGVVYTDYSLSPKPGLAPLNLDLEHVDGHIDFSGDGASSWSLQMSERNYKFAAGAVTGSYNPKYSIVYLRTTLKRTVAGEVNRFLPSTLALRAGYLTATVDFLQTADLRGAQHVQLQGSGMADAVTVRWANMHDPVTQISGRASFTLAGLTGALSGNYLGAPVSVEGTTSFGSDAALDLHASASNLNIAHLLQEKWTGIKVPPSVAAVATANIGIKGPLKHVVLSGAGTGLVSGPLAQQVLLPEPAEVKFRVEGALQNPHLLASVAARSVTIQARRVSGVHTNVEYLNRRLLADFTGQAMGGSVNGRLNLDTAVRRFPYSAILHARAVDLNQPATKTTPRMHATVSADANLVGSGTDISTPSGRAVLRLTNLRYATISADSATANIQAKDKLLTINSLWLRRKGAVAVAYGSADLRAQTVNLYAQLDNLELSSLPVATAHDAAPTIAGSMFIRDGRITGPYKNPQIKGTVRVYDLAAGDRLKTDFASTSLSGTLRKLNVENGQLWRFPAFATAQGSITGLNAGHPQLALRGTFARADLQDLATIAGSTLDASGTASGSWTAVGDAVHPLVAAPQFVVSEPGIASHSLDSITGSLVYDARKIPERLVLTGVTATYRHNPTSSSPDVTVHGTATLVGGRDFTAHVETAGVDLALLLLNPTVADYVAPAGRIDFSTDLAGTLISGHAENMTGSATARIQNLALDGLQLGTYTANSMIRGNSLAGSLIPTGSDKGAPQLQLSSVTYNTKTLALSLDGGATNLPLEGIRKAIASSPYLSRNPDSQIAVGLRQLLPLTGAASISALHVTGSTDNPTIAGSLVALNTTVQGIVLESVKADWKWNKDRIELANGAVHSADALLTAQGVLVPDKELTGSIDMDNWSLATLKSWFPSVPDLQGLSGSADDVHIEAAGLPSDPHVLATVTLSDVEWEDHNPKRNLFGGRPLLLPHIVTSTITIQDGKLAVNDMGVKVTVPRAAAAPRPTTKLAAVKQPFLTASQQAAADEALEHGDEYEAHASGNVDFAWKPPYIDVQTAQAHLNVAIKDQPLGLLEGFGIDPRSILDGTIHEATLAYTGPIRALDTATDTTPSPSILEGVVDVSAKRITGPGIQTELHNLDARIVFDGQNNRLRIERFSAQSFVPRTKAPGLSGAPVTITGDLPIHSSAVAGTILVSAPRVLVAESPLPGIGSGSIAGEISTQPDAPGKDSPIKITGSLFRPTITGTIFIRNTYMRIPDAIATTGPTVNTLPVNPHFDLRFVAARNVRMFSPQLNATVRTVDYDPLILTGTPHDPVVHGTMMLQSGTLTFPTARFTLQPGGTVGLQYPYQATGLTSDKTLGILLDLTATTQLTATSVAGVRKRYTLTVAARGPLDSSAPLVIADSNSLSPSSVLQSGLHLTFRADPPDLALSSAGLQQRVTGLLGGQEAIQGLFKGNLDVGGVFGGVVSSVFLPELFDRSGIARALGLQEFALDYNQLDAFTLRISRQIYGPFSMSYWTRLAGVGQQGSSERASWQFKLSYRIRNNILFSFTTDEQRANGFLLEGVMTF